jgi:hypothetical protein
MATQRSVAVQFWISPSVKGVPPATKLFALYCMTGPPSSFAWPKGPVSAVPGQRQGYEGGSDDR